MKKARVLIFMLCVLTGMLISQGELGILRGVVTDSDGNALPGVEVTLAGNNFSSTAVSDENGAYRILGIPPGVYTVKSHMEGFKTVTHKRFKFSAGQQFYFNQKMELGKIETCVEVVGEAPMIDVKSSSCSVTRRRRSHSGGSLFRKKSRSKQVYQQAVTYTAPNTEEYAPITSNGDKEVLDEPLSTFSIDVDTASYANVRRFIQRNLLPPVDAVRLEEMVNYFNYDYPQPQGEHPFSVTTELSQCPWEPDRHLVHIGLKGREISRENRKPSNLVFLLDVSGSMDSPNKLPLLKRAFKLMVPNLTSEDRVTIVVYAGSAGLVLDSTAGSNKQKIYDAINQLQAGGSTAGGAGIKLAYRKSNGTFIRGGNNRVVLATDGDFNVGISSTSELVQLIEKEREKGIFLTILGFGSGNLKDYRLEQLADKGNGHYHYIDGLLEARKVFVDELGSTLFTIAKDVKIQVEFNPAKIKSYRLVGYENRLLNKKDFKDDTKDAGELGSGYTVTVLYELVPAGPKIKNKPSESLKYQEVTIKQSAWETGELMTVKLRYKQPDGEKSRLIETRVTGEVIPLEESSDNFRFSSVVAQFGMLLRDRKLRKKISFEKLIPMAKGSMGEDSFGYRSEFIQLVKTCSLIDQSNR